MKFPTLNTTPSGGIADAENLLRTRKWNVPGSWGEPARTMRAAAGRATHSAARVREAAMIELSSESVDMLRKFVARLTPEDRTRVLERVSIQGKDALLSFIEWQDSSTTATEQGKVAAVSAYSWSMVRDLARYIGYAVLEAALVEAEG